MPATWIQALGTMTEQWGSISKWRAQEMQVIRDAANSLQPQRAWWASTLHADVHKVIGHLHLPFLDWLMRHASYPNQNYVKKLMRGKPDLGDILPTGVFREERNEASMALSAWVKDPKARNLKMLAMVGSTGDAKLDQKAWEKLQRELTMQYCEGPGELAELDLDKVCLTPRFPKWELKDGSWSVRNISDWRASQGNATVTLPERYSPEDLTTAHAIIRILRGVFPKGTHAFTRIQG